MSKKVYRSLAEWKDHYLSNGDSDHEEPIKSIEDAKELGRQYGNASIESLITHRPTLSEISHKVN